MKKNPLVSVIIVNYNGKKYLLNCLKGVLVNTYSNYEVIVVDNGSTDGSVEVVKEKYGQAKNCQVIKLSQNFGPAYARNRGAEEAKGKYLAFLDNDTLPEKGWLTALVKAMEADPTIGVCQCKLLLMKEKNKFDYAGDYLSQYGFLVQRVEAGEVDKGQADQKEEILSAKSAAMMIRKDVFQKIGGFDEDYFIYLEETDLGWRSWLAGYQVIFVPDSKVYHEFGTTAQLFPEEQSFRVKFHGTKNYIATLIKNLEIKNLVKILPLHLFLWSGIGFWLILKGRGKEGILVFRGIFWNLGHLPSLAKKRAIIQKKRRVSDQELFPKIFRKKPIKYFYAKLTGTPLKEKSSWSK